MKKIGETSALFYKDSQGTVVLFLPLDVTLLRITMKQCWAAHLHKNICTPHVICLSVWDAQCALHMDNI